MKRALILIAALALAGCAASPADSGQNGDLAFALGHDLSCNATEARQCPAGGCAPGQAGEVWAVPISLSVPDRGGAGRFCIATGCEDAQFAPTLTRALGWTARMVTSERTRMNANLEIARDLSTFTLRSADSGSISTWTGVCNAAGS